MDRVCSHCHAELGPGIVIDWCPACGGALIDRPAPAAFGDPDGSPLPLDVDHRGIILPRRHALGGIITPQ
jgi:hypothetical protein